MYAPLHILCALALAVGSHGAPEKWEVGFKYDVKGQADLKTKAEVKVKNGIVSGDVDGSAAGNVDSKVQAGASYESKGKIIGINGGLNGNIGGSAQGGAHGEVGLNKDGSIGAKANSTLSTTSHTGVSGHANIATGDHARRQVALYEGNNATVTGDEGTETDLLPLISIADNILKNIWLYVWLIVGFIIFVIGCCLFAVCWAYLKLVGDVKRLKMEKVQTQYGANVKGAALDKEHVMVQMKDWE